MAIPRNKRLVQFQYATMYSYHNSIYFEYNLWSHNSRTSTIACTTELQATSKSLRDNSHLGYNPSLKMDDSRAIPLKWKQIPAGNPQNTNDGRCQGKGKALPSPSKCRWTTGEEGNRFPSPLKHRQMMAEEEGVLFEMRTDNGDVREGDLPCPSKRTTEGRISLCLQKTDRRRQRRGSARKGGGLLLSTSKPGQHNVGRGGANPPCNFWNLL